MNRTLLAFTVLIAAAPAYAQGISVTVNGESVPFPGQAPMQAPDGTILVPLRGIFEKLYITSPRPGRGAKLLGIRRIQTEHLAHRLRYQRGRPTVAGS